MQRNEFPDKINIDDLFAKKKITADLKISIYTKILNRVHSKIKATSRIRNSNKFCFYLIPEFVLGIPRYDVAACTSFILEKLIDNGFMIKYTYPNLLFISWQHYIPHYTRAEIKKKTGVSVDGYGNVIKKTDKKKDKGDLNSLLLKDKSVSLKIKKKENKDYKDISTYKPTGTLIYNTDLLKRIETSITNKKIDKSFRP